MLTREENELLSQVSRGTPMGELMRQYWMPVIYDWELEPDGQPQRVRVLGEDLLAWRDTNGTPAFTQNLCPHRGASLYFGRNEKEGLRCAYHGWKFDVNGNCVDMPNEPATSNFKNKLKITSYMGADFGGIVWAYMGDNQKNPPLVPQFEWGLIPEEQRGHTHKFIEQCNWMQLLEGELDSTHVYFLHSRLDKDASPKYGLYHPDQAATFHVVNKNYGIMYGAHREEEGRDYWRVAHFLYPIYGMFPAVHNGVVPLSIYMPVDDTHTLHFQLRWHPTTALQGSRRPTFELPDEPGVLGGPGPMKPEQKGKFYAKWWPVVNHETDFHMDLDAKKNKSFTGIPSVRQQDAALEWSMGAIMDRTKEHLGTADAAIIKTRRKLIAAAREFAEAGTPPPGSENPEWYTVRSCEAVLPAGENWQEALGPWLSASTLEYPDPLSTGRSMTPGVSTTPGV
jgi:phthalate 4,5-dioxygenase oxygenase subunit